MNSKTSITKKIYICQTTIYSFILSFTVHAMVVYLCVDQTENKHDSNESQHSRVILRVRPPHGHEQRHTEDQGSCNCAYLGDVLILVLLDDKYKFVGIAVGSTERIFHEANATDNTGHEQDVGDTSKVKEYPQIHRALGNV